MDIVYSDDTVNIFSYVHFVNYATYRVSLLSYISLIMIGIYLGY